MRIKVARAAGTETEVRVVVGEGKGGVLQEVGVEGVSVTGGDPLRLVACLVRAGTGQALMSGRLVAGW
ncbi:hypothetical protein GCM10010324_03960 [Streptomyces hiroshimensis]|uniref:Uncharacterized protein n=1 Tax=Streptomyces hiroshimensis TaxID=66424 RepID=A0ABQ2Y3T6_9ACTN|nr:hypothetical protein GCM10010324_03960 [Streptomyces hiroshimensis]